MSQYWGKAPVAATINDFSGSTVVGRATVDSAQITEMLESVDWVDFMEREWNLVVTPSSKGWFQAQCPFPDHDDSDPSFGFNAETGKYKCFGCSRSGNLIDFMRQMEGISFFDAVRKLANLSGRDPNQILGARGGGAETDDEVSAALWQIERSIAGFLSIKSSTKLPGGVSHPRFLLMIAERLRTFEGEYGFDEDVCAFTDGLYTQIDTQSLVENEKGLSTLWTAIPEQIRNYRKGRKTI